MKQSRQEVVECQRRVQIGKLRYMVEKWQQELPNLKAERILIERSDKEKVEFFRLQRYGRMLLDCMRIEA